MSKRRRTPLPPVQAPKRRPGKNQRKKAGGNALPAWPRSTWLLVAVAIGVAAIAAGSALYFSTGSSQPLPLEPASALGTFNPAPPPGPAGPETVPIPKAPPLARAGWLTLGQTVDGITCQPIEQLSYHIHAHLTIFIDGKARLIPYGIGIAPPRTGTATPAGYFVTQGTCFSWLHTHASDGVIHIESPTTTTYTLGDFFDIWHQPLSPTRIGPAHGHVTALFDGKLYTGNPRTIPLLKHAQIQLEIGKPRIAPETVTFPQGL